MKPPTLRHIVNLWSLVDYPNSESPWSLEQQIADIKESGFDGFSALLTQQHQLLAEKYHLSVLGYFATAKKSHFRSLIQQNQDAGAIQINVQLGDHDTPVVNAIELCCELMSESKNLGAKCAVEVHRDTCTETPEKFYAIADGFRKATGEFLPVTWDFSHLSVVKHLAPPYAERLLTDTPLIQQSEQFHLRPFNGHHCQVPVTDGHGQLSCEVLQWLPFLDELLALWLRVPQDGRVFFATPEMGPVRGGYNFADLPNSYDDAKVLRTLIDDAWKKALAASR